MTWCQQSRSIDSDWIHGGSDLGSKFATDLANEGDKKSMRRKIYWSFTDNQIVYKMYLSWDNAKNKYKKEFWKVWNANMPDIDKFKQVVNWVPRVSYPRFIIVQCDQIFLLLLFILKIGYLQNNILLRKIWWVTIRSILFTYSFVQSLFFLTSILFV